MNENYFAELNSINVNDKTEEKNGLTYLSWAWAWAEVKKRYPDSTYTVYENAAGWNYHTDGRTAWVKTGVTVNGIEHIEYLPVMDHRNRSIPLESITSFDVNKTIQRSLTKACARHGIGLYIYAGEDLPEGEDPKHDAPAPKEDPPKKDPPKKAPPKELLLCEKCKAEIVPYIDDAGKTVKPERIARSTMEKYGKVLCVACAKAAADAS